MDHHLSKENIRDMTISYENLFISASRAETPEDMQRILMNEESLWKNGEPKSLFDLNSRPVGGKENNAGPIEAASSPMAAINEKVSNGNDSVNLGYQLGGLFPSGEDAPKSPTEAMDYIAKDKDSLNGGVYLFTSTKAFADPKISGKETQSENCMVLDTGTGIRTEDFASTIMSIQSSNKMGNHLLAGSFGYGGSMVYRYSSFTFVATISDTNPDIVTFTVVFRVHAPLNKSHHYVYLTGPDGEPLTADLRKVPPSKLVRVVSVKEAKALATEPEGVLQRKFPIGYHGTAVKMIGYTFPPTTIRSKMQMWAYLRGANFGNPIPLHFVHLLGTDKSRAHNRSYGLRYGLRNLDKSLSYDCLHHEPPHKIINGKATMELWVIDFKRDEKGLPKQADGEASKSTSHGIDLSAPVSGLIEQGKHRQCVYITLNGQTHKRMTCGVILRNTDFGILDGHVIIEINIDNMNPIDRSAFITSTRENLSEDGEAAVREAIIKYLKDENTKGSPLRIAADKLRENLLRKQAPKIANGDFISRLMTSLSVLSSRFGGRGASLSGTAGTDARGIKQLFDPPTQFNLNNQNVIERGKTAYFTVITNATDFYGDKFHLDLSRAPGLEILDRKAFSQGRMSFQILCPDTIEVGTTMQIGVRLEMPDGHDDFSGEWEIDIMEPIDRPKQETKPKSPKTKAIPTVDVEFVGKGDAQFERLRAGAVSMNTDDIAYAYIDMGSGLIQAYANLDFVPYRNALVGKKGDRELTTFKSKYEAAITAAIIIRESRSSDTEMDVVEEHAIRGDCMTTWLAMQSLDSDVSAGGKKLRKAQIAKAQSEADDEDSNVILFQRAN